MSNKNFLDTCPKYPFFRNIKFSERGLYNEFIEELPPFSDYIFSNLYDWRVKGMLTRFSNLDGNLIIRTCDVSTEKYSTWIIGSNNIVKTIKILLQKYKNINLPYFVFDENHMILNKSFYVQEDPSNHEYIYNTLLQISMKGNRYESFRRNVKKFQQQESIYDLRIITNPKRKNDLYGKIEELFHSWSIYKSNGEPDKYNTFFEFDSLKQYLIHAKQYDVRFLGLYKDDKLVGFSTIELDRKRDIAYVCYAKSSLEEKGMSEYIFFKSAEYINSMSIKYLNFEQDLGILNLRRYKDKLSPEFMYKAYIISSII